MRFFTTWTLVLLLSLSLTLGCKKKTSSSASGNSSGEVADNGSTSDAGMTGGAGPGMDGGAGPGMDGDPSEEGMDEDMAAGFEGGEGFDPAEEGMDDEDLAAGFEGGEGFDPAEDGSDEDLAAGFEGGEGFDPANEDPDGTGAAGGFAGPGGTADPGGFAGGGRPAQRKPATLLDASHQAFAKGQTRNGFNYAFAAVLLDPEAGPKLLNQYQWVPALKRPVLGVRWGIGVQFVGSKDAAKKPYPIGVEQKLPEKRSANRNRGDDFGGGNPDDFGADPGGLGDDALGGGFPGSGGGSQGGNSELKKYTGTLGDKVMQRLRGRIERGYYGTLLKTAKSGGSSAGGQSAGGFDPAEAGFDPAEAGFDPADEGLDGTGAAGGFAGPGAGGQRGSSSGGLPGVTMLGVGTLDQLSQKAQQSDLDAVIIFEVKVVVNPRTKLVTNNTTIQLFDVQMGKVVKKNKTVLNNVKIQIQGKTAKGNEVDEMIEKEIDQIFLAAEVYRVKDLPQLTAQVVLDNRVMPMVSKKYANPLPMLAELRFWHARNLLTTEHLTIACKELVGEKVAQQLLSGDAKSQQAVVKGLLSNNAAEGAESGPAFR